MKSIVSGLALAIAGVLVLPSCSDTHDPFYHEPPTFTLEVTADPPASMRDLETYGFWTFPATVKLEGVELLDVKDEVHIGETSAYGYDFHVEAAAAERTWSLMTGPMVMGDDGDFVHEWHLDGIPDAPTVVEPAAGFTLYAKILDETPAPGEATVSLYSDIARTQLVAEGSGPDETEVVLNEMNLSGISGEAHMELVTGDNSNITLMFNTWMEEPRAGETHRLMVGIGASAATEHDNHNTYADIPSYHHVELSLIDQANPLVPVLEDEELEWVQTRHGLRLVGNYDLTGLAPGAYDVHIHVGVPEAKRDVESILKWLDEIEFEFQDLDWDGMQFNAPPAQSFPLTLLNSPADDMEATLRVGASPKTLIDHGLIISPAGSENVSFTLTLRDPNVAPAHSDVLPYGNVKVVVTNELTGATLETNLEATYGGEHGFHFARNIALPLAGEVVEEEGGGGGQHQH